MLIPTFHIQLNNAILHQLVTVGKFDGKHPSLACANSTDNIIIHSPHTRNEENEHEIRHLSVNRRISALDSGDLENKDDKPRDILLVGTHTNLLAYDVEGNSDIFYKDVPDGVNSLAVGTVPGVDAPLAMVGGNCSILGFDAEGEEQFWTVTGDLVSALAFRDSGDGQQQLLVGSHDFDIRIFQNEEPVSECSECDVISGLCAIQDTFYGYALQNGTIGVYNNDTRVWHAKSKHKVQGITAFDLDSDGVPELVAGWSNGRIEVRNDQNGELIYKDRFPSAVAEVLVADYHMDGQDEIIACSVDGEIRGYNPAEEEQQGNLMEVSQQDNILKHLYNKKQEMMQELKNYENNIKQIKSGTVSDAVIPTDTNISIQTKHNTVSQSLMVTLSTNNDTVIKCGVVFCEVMFEDESFIVHPQRPSSTLQITLRPKMNLECDMLVKVVVGHRSSVQDHVFEINQHMPKFASFYPVERSSVNPTSNVTFQLNERVNRILLWVQTAFMVDDSMANGSSGDGLTLAFKNVRNDEPILLEFTDGAQMTISTNSMELAGELVQELCKYLGLTDLESTADFPEEMKDFTGVLDRVDEHNSIRLRLSAEIADSSNMVKALVVKAEDARILNDVNLMSKMYSALFDLNRELIGEYRKRTNNHQELLKTLKDVNQMIQKAARLRCGPSKAQVVADSRKAIKGNKVQTLFNIIKVGRVN